MSATPLPVISTTNSYDNDTTSTGMSFLNPPVRVVIVGASTAAGRRHVDLVAGGAADAVLVAIIDPTPAGDELAHALGVINFADVEDVLDSDICVQVAISALRPPLVLAQVLMPEHSRLVGSDTSADGAAIARMRYTPLPRSTAMRRQRKCEAAPGSGGGCTISENHRRASPGMYALLSLEQSRIETLTALSPCYVRSAAGHHSGQAGSYRGRAFLLCLRSVLQLSQPQISGMLTTRKPAPLTKEEWLVETPAEQPLSSSFIVR